MNISRKILVLVVACMLLNNSSAKSKHHRKESIVGSYNLKLVSEPYDYFGTMVFHADGTVAATKTFAFGVLRSQVDGTTKYGTWKKVGKNQYKVVLSSIIASQPDQGMNSQTFQRLVEDLDVTFTHKGKIAELTGLYYLYDPYDLCLEGPRQQDGPVVGVACKMARCLPESREG